MKKLLYAPLLIAIFLSSASALQAAAERDPEAEQLTPEQELVQFASMCEKLLEGHRHGLDAYMEEYQARQWEEVGRLTLLFIEQGKNEEEVKAALAVSMKDKKKGPSAWYRRKQEENNKKVQDFLARKTPETKFFILSRINAGS
jgi:hypothetical protein